ncbi:MAG: phosphoserine phosphatase SerB [Actinomycetota bacterium]|nr:phosphoserine phosphatase SerB [Actinomycetota bacterium]
MPSENISQFTGLILVSGQDRPGIMADLMTTLSEFSVKIIDVQQICIRGRLILAVLISLDQAHAEAVAIDLDLLQKRNGLDIAIDFAEYIALREEPDSLVVIIVGKEIKPLKLALIASEIAKMDGNIKQIRRSEYNSLESIELQLSIPNKLLKVVQQNLKEVALLNDIDLSVELGGSARQRKRIVLLDMDSTLIEQEVIDLLAEHAGQGSFVAEITKQAMNGEINFKEALEKRVGALKDIDASIFNKVRKEIKLAKGAQEMISKLHVCGHLVGVVSGGFLNVIEPILQDLKIDFYRANKLEVIDGKLTGKLEGDIIDSDAKLLALKELALLGKIDLAHTVAVGDGANDIDMIESAGLGIAFNGKSKLNKIADTTISQPDLSAVLLFMGIQF